MEEHKTYFGIKPFGVLVDESPELESLISQVRELREKPFEEKLNALKKLTLDSMINAYEQMVTLPQGDQKEFFKDIVVTPDHPLSYALEHKAGCCRYQGALFFVLAYEADLGHKHFIQQAPVNPDEFKYGTDRALACNNMRSVFNDLIHNNQIHHISIFKESLKDKSLDYSIKNPRVFESAIGFGWPQDNPSPIIDPWKMRHYSYHRTEDGLIIVSEDSRHVPRIPVKGDN